MAMGVATGPDLGSRGEPARAWGESGPRDPGLLESALARPMNLVAYGSPDAADLAACYCAGIVQNHPFVDGNKRAGFLALGLFLALNGLRLTATQLSATEMVLGLAEGSRSEADVAAWVRAHLAPRQAGPQGVSPL